ncbi:hypothetical protein VTJ04DRAFT_8011 [Mycothermus thermophilus]|uniref:uncharacterized protein n=1 Tax=Humicola insolens TaxID=85995 RepID=UPI00374424F6
MYIGNIQYSTVQHYPTTLRRFISLVYPGRSFPFHLCERPHGLVGICCWTIPVIPWVRQVPRYHSSGSLREVCRLWMSWGYCLSPSSVHYDGGCVYGVVKQIRLSGVGREGIVSIYFSVSCSKLKILGAI